MNATAAAKTPRFQTALTFVESLPTDDQAALAEVVAKGVGAKRRRQLVKEIAQARQDCRAGGACRGSESGVMADLRQ